METCDKSDDSFSGVKKSGSIKRNVLLPDKNQHGPKKRRERGRGEKKSESELWIFDQRPSENAVSYLSKTRFPFLDLPAAKQGGKLHKMSALERGGVVPKKVDKLEEDAMMKG